MYLTALIVIACLCLYELGGRWAEKVRCGYCGVLAGHDQHCPFQGIDI